MKNLASAALTDLILFLFPPFPGLLFGEQVSELLEEYQKMNKFQVNCFFSSYLVTVRFHGFHKCLCMIFYKRLHIKMNMLKSHFRVR